MWGYKFSQNSFILLKQLKFNKVYFIKNYGYCANKRMSHWAQMTIAYVMLTFAVNSNGPLHRLTNLKELEKNCITRRPTISKEQFKMIESHICKSLWVVHFAIETDDCCHILATKVGDVSLWSMERITYTGKNIYIRK